MDITVVVGLGNPGIRYQNTLHNVGFRVVDRLAAVMDLTWRIDKKLKAEVSKLAQERKRFLFVKPLTYMNLSGEAVRPLLEFYGASSEDLLVISDDADLPLGEIRFRKTGSAGGHNGLKSIEEHLKTSSFKRLKFGIGHPRNAQDDKSGQTLADYVLEVKGALFWEQLEPKIEEAANFVRNFSKF